MYNIFDYDAYLFVDEYHVFLLLHNAYNYSYYLRLF